MKENEKIIITKYDLMYEQRMTRVESAIEGIEKRFTDRIDGIEKRFTDRMDLMDKRLDSMDRRMMEGFKDIKTDFRWLVLIMLGSFGTLFGFMAHGFKWFL